MTTSAPSKVVAPKIERYSRVFVFWKDHLYYTATVTTALPSNEFYYKWDDEEFTQKKHMKEKIGGVILDVIPDNSCLSVGQQIIVFWPDAHKNRYYDATIKSIIKGKVEPIYIVTFTSDGTLFSSTNKGIRIPHCAYMDPSTKVFSEDEDTNNAATTTEAEQVFVSSSADYVTKHFLAQRVLGYRELDGKYWYGAIHQTFNARLSRFDVEHHYIKTVHNEYVWLQPGQRKGFVVDVSPSVQAAARRLVKGAIVLVMNLKEGQLTWFEEAQVVNYDPATPATVEVQFISTPQEASRKVSLKQVRLFSSKPLPIIRTQYKDHQFTLDELLPFILKFLDLQTLRAASIVSVAWNKAFKENEDQILMWTAISMGYPRNHVEWLSKLPYNTVASTWTELTKYRKWWINITSARSHGSWWDVQQFKFNKSKSNIVTATPGETLTASMRYWAWGTHIGINVLTDNKVISTTAISYTQQLDVLHSFSFAAPEVEGRYPVYFTSQGDQTFNPKYTFGWLIVQK